MFRSIGKSALAIVLVQGINFLVPLLALPHISRMLGLHQFGIYMILLSYGNYVLLVSDFSFNVNGPLLVAQSQRESRLRSLAVDTTMLKLALLVPALIAFAIASWFVTDRNWLYIIMGAMIPVTTTLTPRWIMYSVGQIYAFAGASAIAKGLWIASIYLLVRGPNDLGAVLTMTAATQLLLCAMCGAAVWFRSTGGARPTVARITAIFRRDFKQFTALIATSSLRDLGVVVLSATSGPAHVSIYALADRVRFAIMGVVTPVSQSLFLVTARHGTGDGGVQQRVRGLVNMAILAAASACGIGVLVMAGQIVHILGGAAFAGSVPILRIVALAPTFTALNSILGVNTLLGQGLSAEYASAQLTSVSVSGPTMLILVWLFGVTGAAAGVLWTEVFATILLVRACRRHNVLDKAFSLR